MSLFVFFILLLIVTQHVSGNHVPIIRRWRLRDVLALCWYVPWLQQLDVTFCNLYFSCNSSSTCFGQPCDHHQELTTASCYSPVLVCVVAALTRCHLMYFLILFYYLLNKFRVTMCPTSVADDCVMLQPCVGICRGCGNVGKTGWQVVLPLLFY